MAYDKNAPASERQFLAYVTGWDGAWATVEGGEVEAKVEKVWDGGARTPSVLPAPSETSNVTVSRPYKPGIHAVKYREWARKVGSIRTTVSIKDTDADLMVIGSPTTYANAILVRAQLTGGDASSSNARMIELEFAVPGMA